MDDRIGLDRRKCGRALVVGAGLAVFGLAGTPATAFHLYDGDSVRARLDTTLSYAIQWRVQKRDKDLIARGNGGEGASANYDDGNLNYDRGVVSNLFKVISELEVRTDRFGGFIRGTGFYDIENEDGDRARTELSDDAKELVGSDIDLLDAYLWADLDLGPMPFQIRVGEQVVSWGESTFIFNGINTINPIDVSKVRVPGAELRDALVPEGMVWATLSMTDNLSLEGVYLYDWGETLIDPVGSYFSTADYAGEGVRKVVLDFGTLSDEGNTPWHQTLMGMRESDANEARDQGQFGVALRAYVPALHDTEFSFYYLRYHSRLPMVGSRTGTLAGATSAGTIAAAATPIATDVATYLATNPGDVNGAIASGTAVGVAAGAPQAASQAIAGTAATGGDVATVTQAVATDAYVKTMTFRSEYPEDIQLLGLGFNTEIFGIALQGEVAHRRDHPLQIDDVELMVAPLGVIDPGIAATAQLGDYSGQFEQWIDGWVERDTTQMQATVTKLLGPTVGADGGALLGEVGWFYVHDMPSKDDLRLQTLGTYASGDRVLGPALHPGTAVESASDYPDASSWGYVLLAKLDYEGLIGPLKVSPRVAWAHDVNGISPGPGGPFLEGRKAVTVALGFDYQAKWEADVSYTNFFGAGRHNMIHDRDFIGLSAKYSF